LKSTWAWRPRARRSVNALYEKSKVKELRNKLINIFNDAAGDLKKMSDKDMKSLAAFYRNGVHMATPVFDGAKEEEIKKLLVEAGI
jgi:DNA-directed RNA polymerase subunit beta